METVQCLQNVNITTLSMFPKVFKKTLAILTELCKFTSFQVAWIGSVVRFTGALATLNNAAMIFKWLIQFLDMLVCMMM